MRFPSFCPRDPRPALVPVWDGTRDAASLLGERPSHPYSLSEHAPEAGGFSSTRDERRRAARLQQEATMAKKKTGGKKGC